MLNNIHPVIPLLCLANTVLIFHKLILFLTCLLKPLRDKGGLWCTTVQSHEPKQTDCVQQTNCMWWTDTSLLSKSWQKYNSGVVTRDKSALYCNIMKMKKGNKCRLDSCSQKVVYFIRKQRVAGQWLKKAFHNYSCCYMKSLTSTVRSWCHLWLWNDI